MSNPSHIQRRHLLLAAGAAPLAVLPAGPVLASAAQIAISTVDFRRFRVGQFEVTTLLAGMRTVDNPQAIFGMNVSEEDFANASKAANIPTNAAQFFFTPTLVNTGAELVLFDTGLNPAGITAAIGAAGYTPDQVDIVVLTHMHGDHIGGLSGDMGV